MSVLWMLLFFAFSQWNSYCLGEPVADCPQFVTVTENENFTCECTSPTGETSCRLSWPGHTEGPVLNIASVRRQDNGSQFNCQMDCDGTPTNTTVILNIAYGPSADGVRVTGPASFVTDGTRPLILECEAGDVNPPPTYTWRGMNCENGPSGSTCVLTPKHYQDGQDVECKVTNTHTTTTTSVSAVYRLNLSYPPPSPPKLSRSIVQAGDIINCTVTGGKPPVSSVQFSCSNNTWPDQPDTIEGSTVTSSLVLVDASEGEVRCQCSAEWEPQPELYRHKQDSIITVMTPMGGEPQGPKHEQTENGDPFPATIGGAAAGVLVVIGFVVFVVIFVRKKTGGSIYERPLPRRQEDITVYQGIISPQLRQLPDVQTNRKSENYEVVDVTPMQVLAGNPRGVRPPSSSPPASPPEDSDGYLEPNPRPPPRF